MKTALEVVGYNDKASGDLVLLVGHGMTITMAPSGYWFEGFTIINLIRVILGWCSGPSINIHTTVNTLSDLEKRTNINLL